MQVKKVRLWESVTFQVRVIKGKEERKQMCTEALGRRDPRPSKTNSQHALQRVGLEEGGMTFLGVLGMSEYGHVYTYDSRRAPRAKTNKSVSPVLVP